MYYKFKKQMVKITLDITTIELIKILLNNFSKKLINIIKKIKKKRTAIENFIQIIKETMINLTIVGKILLLLMNTITNLIKRMEKMDSDDLLS